MNPDQRRRSNAIAAESKARTRLLEATIDLLKTGGPEVATSRAIATAADENLASITYYFGSKSALLSEAMTSTARRLIQPVVDEFADKEKDSIAKLMAAAQALYEILRDNADLLGPYLHSLAAAPNNDIVGVEVRTLHRDLSAILETEMESQQQQGQLPEWIKPQPMAQLIVALVDGVAVSTAIDPTLTQPAAIGAQFAQLLLAARTTG